MYKTHPMNKAKKQKVKELYLQTDLTKSQIARMLGINRSTVHFWIKVERWERIKKAADALPTLIADRIYSMLGNFTNKFVGEQAEYLSVSRDNAETIHKLVTSIQKLRKFSTIAENMESFSYFHERLKVHNEELATQLTPFIEWYISDRALNDIEKFDTQPASSQKDLPPHIANNPPGVYEHILDEQDMEKWAAEMKEKGFADEPPVNDNITPVPPPQNDTPQPQPTPS